jgi:serpin B
LVALSVVAGCGSPSGAALSRPDATVLPTAATTDALALPTDASRAPTRTPTADPASKPTIAKAAPTAAAGPTSAPVVAASANDAAKAIDALGADLYRQLARDQQNLVFSPYSVEIALAMARAGAAGATATQMDTVLHAALVGDLDSGLVALDRELAKRPGRYPYGAGTVPLELGMANRLWAQRGFDFGVPFLDRLSTRYGTGMGLVDYIGSRDDARRAINEWVSARTRARIPELVPDGVLNDLTRFVLTNAIYLKAKWQRSFPTTETRPAPFHRLDGTDSQAQLMTRGVTTYAYGRGAGYQAISLPYVGGLSMVVVVPDAGAFAAFESSLDAQRLRQVVDGLAYSSVDLRFPRFTFRTAAPLKEALSRLGMPLAFTKDADFSGISPHEPLHIQAAIHEAFIAVDEEGTEAAAATAVIGGATGGPNEWVTLTIDRPFLFLIRDDATGATLFMGRVLDPS